MSLTATGAAIAPGIAIGAAVIWAEDPAPRATTGVVAHERLRLTRAIARTEEGIRELVRLLPPHEAELFEPEITMLEELGPELLERVASGTSPEDAVRRATDDVPTDLLTDARARLLDALAHGDRSVESLLEGSEGDRVLVTPDLTPSVVAALPARVVGIVAASAEGNERGLGYTSHASILARGRDIVLALVPRSVVARVEGDDSIVVDATSDPARIWVGLGESLVRDARARRDTWMRERIEMEGKVTAPLTHLGVEVLVNLDVLGERVPASAEGIGLVRTELLFSDYLSAPNEANQFWAFRALAARVGPRPIVARLFDAGGDKPLAWLAPPPHATQARGMELLFHHPAVLDTQLRAMVRASEHATLSVLLPLVRTAADVEQVRSRARGRLPIGAMVETTEAAARVDAIATAADFLCIGTNDLGASVTGQSRTGGALSPDARLLRVVEDVTARAHGRGRKVTVCGELAGDPHGARILVGLGVDALSVAAGRFAKVKLALRDLSREDCRSMAREALR